MKLFRLNFATLMARYYLMMAVVIVAGFTGHWWLALLALPIFLSCLTGLNFMRKAKAEVDYSDRINEAPTRKLEERDEEVQTAA